MKTDHPLYRFLTTGPEAFRLLSGGLTLQGPYRTSAPVLKTLERRIDGLLEPIGHDGSVWVLEFQAQSSPHAGYNLVTKVGAYGEEHPTRDVFGLLVLLHEGLRPAKPVWLSQQDHPGFILVVLRPMLQSAYAAEPDNPHLAALAPLFLEPQALCREGARLWNTVRKAPDPLLRETLSEVLEYWLFDVFKDMSAKEIWAMLNVMTPIEQTKAYQSILLEGRAEGRAQGKAEAKADTLKRLLARRFGAVPLWGQERIEKAKEAVLDAWLEGIFDAASLEALIGPPET